MRALARARRRGTGSRSSRTPARRTAPSATASRAGAAGLAAAFSFYPGKNLGAMGDAGALVTDDDGARRRACARCASTASARSTSTSCEGYTARLDTIQALVLLRKLPLLDGWNDERRAVAALLPRGARGRRRPRAAAGRRRAASPVWHLFVVRTADPDALAALPARARHRARAATTRSRCTSSPAYARLGLRARRVPGRRGARRASASRCRSSRASTERAASSGRRRGPRLLRRWLTRPANDAPYRLIARRRVRRGRRRPRRSRTSTAAGSATARGSARSSRSSAAPSIGARCKIQSHTFICDGVDDRGRGVRRPRRDVRQRQAPARDDRRRASCRPTDDWELLRDRRRARGRRSARARSILGGVRIGAGALVGAGAVVTRDVAPGETRRRRARPPSPLDRLGTAAGSPAPPARRPRRRRRSPPARPRRPAGTPVRPPRLEQRPGDEQAERAGEHRERDHRGHHLGTQRLRRPHRDHARSAAR